AEARRQGIREVGYGIRDTWVGPAETVPEIAPITVGEVNTRVTELGELHEHDTHDLYALLEDAQDSKTRISQQVMVDSQQVDLLMEDRIAHQETIQIVKDEAYAAREAWAHSIELSQAVHYELQTHQEQDRVLFQTTQPKQHDSRIRLGYDRSSPSTHLHQWRWKPQFARGKPKECANCRPCFYAGFMKSQPLNFKGTEGVVSLTRWIKKMESFFQISGCAVESQVKFATCTLLDAALTWWNSQIRSLGPDTYSMTWEFVADETEKIDKYVSGLPDNIYRSMKASKPKTLDETIKLANDLMDQKLRTYAERQSNNKRKADESFRNNHGHQQQTHKRKNVVRVYNMRTGKMKPCSGNLPKNNGENPKGNGCFECGATWHFKRDCPKLKNKVGEKVNAPGWVYAVGSAEKRKNVSRDLDSNIVMGTFLLNNRYASILFDTGADRSFISTAFSFLIDIVPTPLGNSYDVELADGKIVGLDTIMRGCTLNFLGHPFNIDLMPVELGSFNAIIGMDSLRSRHAVIVCDEKFVRIPYGNETLTFRGNESNNRRESRLTVISCSKAQEYMAKGCQIFLAQISAKKEEDRTEGNQLEDVLVVRDYPEVFPKDLSGLPLARPVEFQIDLIP
nr:hypothetical protein [Tanacetum cinerariifolium]